MHPRCGSAALAGPWRSLSGRPQSFSQTAARGGRSPKGATMNRFPCMTISALLAAAALAAAAAGAATAGSSYPEDPALSGYDTLDCSAYLQSVFQMDPTIPSECTLAAPDGMAAPSEPAPEEPVYPTEEPLPVADTFETPAFFGDAPPVLPPPHNP